MPRITREAKLWEMLFFVFPNNIVGLINVLWELSEAILGKQFERTKPAV
jgi:hypothetical protein